MLKKTAAQLWDAGRPGFLFNGEVLG